MNVSFSILFLGWWMLGQCQMSRGELYPKPYISIHPRGMVALGGNVSICCWTESKKRVEYYLTKKASSSATTPSVKVADPYKVIFPIVNARISDGGSYWCLYHNKSNDPNKWSPLSDTVYLNLTDPILPKPSIKMIPTNEISPGLNVTIQCRGPENGLTFALHKANMQVAFQTIKPETETAKFLFIMLTLEDAGNYTCQYHQRGSPFVWSEPSEPVELVFRDPILPKPSIKMIPTNEIAPGLNVTILCQGPGDGLTFALHKANMQVAFQTSKPKTETAEFLFIMLTLEDAGSYTCQYHQRGSPFVWSEPSEPVELVFRGSVMAIIPASIAAGIVLLALLLLFVACLLQRKKRKGSITKKENQLMDKALKPDAEEMPDEVSYVTLNHQSQKTKQEPNRLNQRSEACVYSTVVKN